MSVPNDPSSNPEQNAYATANPYTASPLDGPPNNIGWAVAALIFFWPLAFHAFGAATRVDRAWLSDRPEVALAESQRARRLGLISLWIAIGIAVLYVLMILLFTLMPLLFVMIGLGANGYRG